MLRKKFPDNFCITYNLIQSQQYKNIQSQNTAIVIKVIMLRTRVKSLLYYSFCVENNLQLLFYLKVRSRLLKFPYSRIDQKIHKRQFQAQENDFLSQNIKKDTLAFASLKQTNINQLKQYYKILFDCQSQDFQITRSSDDNQKKVGIAAGKNIFKKYFNKKILQIIHTITKSKNQQEINYNLKILFFLKNVDQKFNIYQNPQFKIHVLQRQGTLQQKTYLLNLKDSQNNFLTFLQNYYEQFNKATIQDKFKAALVLISIPEFYNKFNEKLVEECVKVIGDKLETMQSWETFRTLQYIFQTSYQETKNFCDKLMKNLFKQINYQTNKMYVPIFLKLIKLRDRLKMNNSQFEKYAKQNPLKFMGIFQKKRVNKQIFLQIVASKDSKRYLPQQIKLHFITYIQKILTQIIKQKQCDSQDLDETIKLIMKYFHNFTPAKKQYITKLLKQQLIPMFSHQQQSAFWLIILLLRIDKKYLENLQIRIKLDNISKYYHDKYIQATKPFDKHLALQKIIQICYQIMRANLQINTKQLQMYDFKYVKTFQQVIYCCNILTYINVSADKKYQFLKQLLPNIQNMLKNSKVRSSAINVSKSQESINSKSMGYIYKAIQASYMDLLRNDKICPNKSDLIFMRQAFTQKRSKLGEDGKNNTVHNFEFVKFLQNCIKKPQNFRKNYYQYQNKNPNRQKRNLQ